MKGEKKKNELRSHITVSAIKLFKTKGFDKTSMEEIAGRSQITKRTLYNYFPVKEAIIEEFIRETVAEKNAERLNRISAFEKPADQINYYLNELIEGVKREKELFEKYLIFLMERMVRSGQRDNSPKSGITDPADFIIRSGIEKGEINNRIPLSVISDLFLFSFVETAKLFYSSGEEFNQTETVNLMTKLFIKAVSPDRKQKIEKMDEKQDKKKD